MMKIRWSHDLPTFIKGILISGSVVFIFKQNPGFQITLGNILQEMKLSEEQKQDSPRETNMAARETNEETRGEANVAGQEVESGFPEEVKLSEERRQESLRETNMAARETDEETRGEANVAGQKVERSFREEVTTGEEAAEKKKRDAEKKQSEVSCSVNNIMSCHIIWVRSRRCGCLFTWFCYQMIAKPGNMTGTPLWLDPYAVYYLTIKFVDVCDMLFMQMCSFNRNESSAGDARIWYRYQLDN